MTTVGRSFIKYIKSVGPRTEPWGTPLVTFVEVEDLSFIETCWVLPVKKSLTQSETFPPTPYPCNFVKSLSWGTESKAFLKSR